MNAPQFVQDHLASLCSLDLKDAVVGGPSMPFGTGDAHMQQVLGILAGAPTQVTAYIDCDYPGTGQSPEEIERCVRYVRDATNNA